LLAVAVVAAVTPQAQAQPPEPKAATAPGTAKAKKAEAPPLEFLPSDQLPPAAKYAGPEDPDYVAWSKQNPVTQPRPMERLGRGVVAIPFETGKVAVSWRLLASDPDGVAFNVYCTAHNEDRPLNGQPLRGTTFFIDQANTANAHRYIVRTVINGVEGPLNADFLNTIPPEPALRDYVEVPMSLPEAAPRYTLGDASVGDLDGDGEYEIVVKIQQTPRDNSFTGATGNTQLQAYKVDGTLLWSIQMGPNVREGEHYTQFMVYDLDGDGRAEIAVKTADGSVDGTGKVIGDGSARWARADGRIEDGPEFFTIFDGRTGRELATKPYVPDRNPPNGWGGIGGNGRNDNGGNRNERFLACVAYLDGVRPSVVMCRGYYGRSVLVAWDWREGELKQRWVFDTKNGDHPYSGQGGHHVVVADVDDDGRDEIIYHSMVVDDNGKGLYSTGLRHGDAIHVGVFDPLRPTTLQVFGAHENENETTRFGTPGVAVFEAADGKPVWSALRGIDVERAVAADIDPRHPGYEVWSNRIGLHTWQGESIGAAPRSNAHTIWWDGDLLRELLTGARVTKWDWEKQTETPMLTPTGVRGGGAKGTPNLSGDIFGDWREEIIVGTTDHKALRIYTTTIPAEYRMVTLAQDPMYRLALAWQNVAYNQPPHPAFYLGTETKFPRHRVKISFAGPERAEGTDAPKLEELTGKADVPNAKGPRVRKKL
jgi:rhamnogalacturonan endolyase